MYDVIASAFFQKKYCRLPGVGNLELLTIPAEYDFPSQQIKAPRQQIQFIRAARTDNVFNEFSAISQLLREHLQREGTVDIRGLGTFSKQADGTIDFTAALISDDLFQPVLAQKVIHKDAEHSILVGDMETTNVEMTEFFNEEAVVVADRWWIGALIAGLVGIAVIAYYLSQNGPGQLGSAAAY